MKAIICGAGIAGLTLAWWLRRDGWQVRLLEQAARPGTGGHVTDFFGAGYDVAELMGLRPVLRAAHTGVDEVRRVGPAGRLVGDIDYRLYSRSPRERAFSLQRGDLEAALRDALGNAEIRYSTSVDAVVDTGDGVLVVDTHGDTDAAHLLVGADGIHSRVRRLVFGAEERFLHHLGYHTASYTFVDDSVRERLGGRMLVVSDAGRQVGIRPTAGGELACSLIHRAAVPTPPGDGATAVRARYGDLGGLVTSALAHCPTDDGLYYDIAAQVELPGWHHGRVVLVGDACQAASPLAGQGASIAMAGAYVLARQLADRSRIGDALAGCEAWMRPLVADSQRAARRAARWLVPQARWRIAARDAAFALTRLPGMNALVHPTTPGGSPAVPGPSRAG